MTVAVYTENNTKKEIVVNFDRVSHVRPYSDGLTMITFEKEHNIYVREDYNKVKMDFHNALT